MSAIGSISGVVGTSHTASPKDRLFAALRENLDAKIHQNVFEGNWRAMLTGCNIVDFRCEGDNTYRVILDSAYSAVAWDGKGDKWYLEKEILIKLVPENFEIIFPKVKEMHDRNEDPDASNKSLNAIWSIRTVFFAEFTGVGYSSKWDPEQQQVVSSHINNARSWTPGKTTPRMKSIDEIRDEWTTRLQRFKV